VKDFDSQIWKHASNTTEAELPPSAGEWIRLQKPKTCA